MATALVGLGSNLGDRRATLDRALALLPGRGPIRVLAASGYRETPAVGGPAGQPAYLNAAALLQTSLEPRDLLRQLQAVERALGRVRGERWGPRTADLDLLLYDQARLETPELTLPHPRMSFRRFVLEPAAEVAPDLVHPTTGWTIRRLLEYMNTAANYVAVTGLDWTLADSLARALSQELSAEFVALGDVAMKASAQFPPTLHERLDEPWGMNAPLLIEQARFVSHNVWLVAPKCVVSYGWLDFAARHLRGDATINERRQATDAVAAAVRPKLAIVWNPSLGGTPKFGGLVARRESWATDNSLRELAELWQPLRDLAFEPGHGPVLYLETADFDTALAESVAAVRAME